MGVSVEQRRYLHRIEELKTTGAGTKFLSIEPLLEDLGKFDLRGIDWVIVGGESGPGARTMQADWARGIRELCGEHQVPFFFKQWGGTRNKKNGRVLDGVTWAEMLGERTSEALSDPAISQGKAGFRRVHIPHLRLDPRTHLHDTERVKASEFLRRAKRYADSRKLTFRWVPSHGKGSHGTLYLGEHGRTTVQDLKKELPSGTLKGMCAQLFINPKEF